MTCSDSKHQVYFVLKQADQCLCFQCLGSCRQISTVVLMLDLRYLQVHSAAAQDGLWLTWWETVSLPRRLIKP